MTVSSSADQPTNITSSSIPNVKAATPDLILFNEESIPVEQLADLVFQDIGGQEILSVARTDLVNGQKLLYTPIRNLSSIALVYNPQTIFTFDAGANAYFQNFAIKLEDYTPSIDGGSGPDGSSVYIDSTTGNLIVNVTNMSDNEEVDIQVLSSASDVNDIIN